MNEADHQIVALEEIPLELLTPDGSDIHGPTPSRLVQHSSSPPILAANAAHESADLQLEDWPLWAEDEAPSPPSHRWMVPVLIEGDRLTVNERALIPYQEYTFEFDGERLQVVKQGPEGPVVLYVLSEEPSVEA